MTGPVDQTTPRRAAPALALFLLSPLGAEFLLGNIAIDAIAVLAPVAPMYGGAAILVRESARRSGRGWPTMILLATAFGVAEEGLVTQSLFHPSYFGAGLLGYAHIPGLGIGAWWTLFVLTLHAVWSIAVPIAIVEALVPGRAGEPWLGRVGLAVASGLALAGGALSFWLTYLQERFVASPTQLVATGAVIAAIAASAFAPREPRPRAARARTSLSATTDPRSLTSGDQ